MGTSTWSTYLCNQSSASRSKVITHLADPSTPECITPLRIQNCLDVLRTATNGVINRTHEAWHPVPPLERWSPARDAHLSAPPIRGGENHALMCDRVPSFGPSPAPRSITGIKECAHRDARPLPYIRQISPQFGHLPRRVAPDLGRDRLPALVDRACHTSGVSSGENCTPIRIRPWFPAAGRLTSTSGVVYRSAGTTSSSSNSWPRSAGRSPAWPAVDSGSCTTTKARRRGALPSCAEPTAAVEPTAAKGKALGGGVPAERPSRAEAATSCSQPPTTCGWCGGPGCRPRCPSPSP